MFQGLNRLFLALVAAVALLAVPTPSLADDYEGADGGYLVYSVGSISIAMNFTFRFRSTAPVGGRSRPWADVIECRCVGFFRAQMADPDFTGHEVGKVVVRRLPPGDYEIHDFGFGGSLAGMQTSYSSGQPFAIPFTIRPGEATYIGSLMRAPSLGTSLEPQLGAAGFFVIRDQHERDLAIARARHPQLPEPTIAVTDVSAFGHVALRSSEP